MIINQKTSNTPITNRRGWGDYGKRREITMPLSQFNNYIYGTFEFNNP